MERKKFPYNAGVTRFPDFTFPIMVLVSHKGFQCSYLLNARKNRVTPSLERNNSYRIIRLFFAYMNTIRKLNLFRRLHETITIYAQLYYIFANKYQNLILVVEIFLIILCIKIISRFSLYKKIFQF